MKKRILVVDDDAAIRDSCQTILEDEGYELALAASADEGMTLLRQQGFDLALLDLKLPGGSGLEVLEAARKIDPDLVVVIFTAYATIESAVEAIKKGAFNYVTKPFTASQLLTIIDGGLRHRELLQENVLLRFEVDACSPQHAIIGRSEALQNCLAMLAKVAPSEANVLIQGESGTGKELFARAIHGNSLRRKGAFIPIDCAALPGNLLESELFGHERGAFTGAAQLKRGLLELANGGTVFFDEIGEMPAELQAKLLRTLQEHSFRRLGGERLLTVDLRVICSTNRDLQLEAQQGRFRQDLLYRLNVVTLTLPQLRVRTGDVPLLANHFLTMFRRTANKPGVRLAPDVVEALDAYEWPGNVRELRNVMERAVVFSDGEVIRLTDLPDSIRKSEKEPRPPAAAAQSGYKEAREHWLEVQGKQYIRSLLQRHQGNISAAAREAQISRKSFYELLRRYSIAPGDSIS